MGKVTEKDYIKPSGCGVRHLQAFLLFLAMFLAFTMRINMSMAIVAMVADVAKAPTIDSLVTSSAIPPAKIYTTEETENNHLIFIVKNSNDSAEEANDNDGLIEENSNEDTLIAVVSTDTLNDSSNELERLRELDKKLFSRNESSLHQKVFSWDHATQSMILSSFFWGYVILQIPSGELAQKLGGKLLITISISVNSLVSLALPLAATYGGWIAVCVCRAIQGLSQASTYPCMHHLISQWVPHDEKGLLSTIIYAGGPLGFAAQLTASGYIAASWGWQSIFYTNGILGLLWIILYLAVGAGSPESSKVITKEELTYIQKSLGRVGEQKRYPTPWKDIVTSLPFLAVIVAHCGQNWGFFTLMTEMPTYMKNVLDVDLKSNGLLSSLPYLAMYFLSFPMGAITDWLIRNNYVSVSNCRKLFNTIGLWGPALALIGLSYGPEHNIVFPVVMLTLAVGINAGQYTGYMLCHIDMAPNFSASLMGITNFLANIISIIAPLVCGFMVPDDRIKDPIAWRIVFFVAAGVYFFCNLFFILFATSERQPWNEPKKPLEKDIEMSGKKSEKANDQH